MPRPATILFAVCAIMLLTVIYKQREGRILLSIEGRLTRSIENHKSHQAVVVFSSGLWWAKEIGQHWAVPDCTLQGNPVDCHFLSADHISGNTTAEGLVAHADVFVGHICWSNDDVPERFRQLPQVLFSMESERNNPCMRQQLADVEMTYKTCSQVWTPYLPMMYNNAELQIRQGPLPNNAKRNAIIYINSNCGANSGRHSLLTQLDQLLHSSESSISIHSYGSCTTSGSTARGGPDAASLSEFRSASWPLSKRKAMKLKYFGKYKFCVALENSLSQDYVSEKVYDGLIAGCVPIYWGAANIDDFIPHKSAIINYAELGSTEALQEELERLANNQTAYEEKLAWKKWPSTRWNPGFQALMAYSSTSQPFCELCGLIAGWRSTGSRPKYTLCSRNTTWAP